MTRTQESAGHFVEIALPTDAELGAAIAGVAALYGASSPTVVNAAWHAFISRTTGSDEVIVSTLEATPRHPDLDGAVGLIAGPLPIRSSIPAGLTFAELLHQLVESLSDAAAHQAHAPLTGFTAAAGFVARPALMPRDGALRLSLDRVRDRRVAPLALAYDGTPDDVLRLALTFDDAELAREHAELLARQFDRLLRSAVANPGATIRDLDLLGDDDLDFLLRTVNETTADVPTARVDERFSRHATTTPGAVAVDRRVGVADVRRARDPFEPARPAPRATRSRCRRCRGALDGALGRHGCRRHRDPQDGSARTFRSIRSIRSPGWRIRRRSRPHVSS